MKIMKENHLSTKALLSTLMVASLTCTSPLWLSSCGDDYDDTELRNDLGSLTDRVQTLEEQQKSANATIQSLQSLVTALESRNFITSVTPIVEDGKEVGYTIALQTGNPIILRNGVTPTVGTAKGDDGIYYWTVTGSDGKAQFLTDEEGNKLPVSGEKGEAAVAPQVRISSTTGRWEISADGGKTWTDTGVQAAGKDGANGDSFFSGVDTSNPSQVTFRLADGTVFTLPRATAVSITGVAGGGISVPSSGGDMEVATPGLTRDTYSAITASAVMNDGKTVSSMRTARNAIVSSDTDPRISLTPPTFNADGSLNENAKVTLTAGTGENKAVLTVTLYYANGQSTAYSCVVTFAASQADADISNAIASAIEEGGTVSLSEINVSGSAGEGTIPVVQSVTIPSNASNVTLDLGGTTLTTSSEGTAPATTLTVAEGASATLTGAGAVSNMAASSTTLVVESNANVTITLDESGNAATSGTIQAGTSGTAVEVRTNADVIINSGVFTANTSSPASLGRSVASREAPTGNALIVANGGRVTINGGRFISQQGVDALCTSNNGTILVKGGKFTNYNPAAFVAAGYEVVNNEGVYEVVESGQVKEVTTADGLKAAMNDTYVVLGADITLTEAFNMPVKQTIDLNGHTLTVLTIQIMNAESQNAIQNGNLVFTHANGLFVFNANCQLNLKDVNITGTGNCVIIGSHAEGKDYFNNEVTISNSSLKTGKQGVGILLQGKGQKLTMVNSSIDHDWFGITQNGVKPGCNISLTNTHISGTYCGVYLSNQSSGDKNTLTVEGGSFYSKEESGIEVKKTDITVKGATFSSDAATQKYSVNGGGSAGEGYGIVLAGYAKGTAYEGTATFENNTFKLAAGESAIRILKYDGAQGEDFENPEASKKEE